ncbi:uncharacterized protein N7477_009617 [Penicillium maclennaniae]|uniref:uncharacterized protein n=1 Tax=Penicillium maclennaniae TaxID=1343394 RepID=UPI002540CCB5|nr:uncharacterized protein N7477_009617 [Penicillium maclennaniae]KAJ5662001.1 hypothetical protein N7477_009617 [Penicillium maclennaniae]
MPSLWMHHFWFKIRNSWLEKEEGNEDQHGLLPRAECRRELSSAAILDSRSSGEQGVRTANTLTIMVNRPDEMKHGKPGESPTREFS